MHKYCTACISLVHVHTCVTPTQIKKMNMPAPQKIPLCPLQFILGGHCSNFQHCKLALPGFGHHINGGLDFNSKPQIEDIVDMGWGYRESYQQPQQSMLSAGQDSGLLGLACTLWVSPFSQVLWNHV